MPEPQPAALATTTSQSSKASIVARASARAGSSSPAWSWSEPQQRGSVRAATSQPPAPRTPARRAVEVALDLRARVVDELVVADAGRARRDARHAAEAAVEVRHERAR